jgi:hypothetical protein
MTTMTTTENLLVATAVASDTVNGSRSTSRLRAHGQALRWHVVAGDGSEEWDGREYASTDLACLDLALSTRAAAPNLDVQITQHTTTGDASAPASADRVTGRNQ